MYACTGILSALLQRARTGTGLRVEVTMLEALGEWMHPQLAARDRWRDVRTPGGVVQAMLPPATLSGVVACMGDVPSVGEHSVAVLRSIGMPDAEIEALAAAGAI